MTGKEINTNATGLLVLILPFAFLMVLLFKAWPLLLGLFVLSISVRLLQQYQWQQWSKRVNPFFNQLIKENQGCLTPLDLSIKANLSGSAARQYLDKKAEEFGAQLREYEGKGTVYYFLTASALGSMFENSEPPLEEETEEEEEEAVASPTSKLMELLADKKLHPSHDESLTSDHAESPKSLVEHESDSSVEVHPTDKVEAIVEPLEQQQPEYKDAPYKEEHSWNDSQDEKKQALKSLIQAELAKRLDVHSSTVGKRKSDDDFPEWSQGRDPEGIAWKYYPETKEFLPVEKIPALE